jgi:hypothetical protein
MQLRDLAGRHRPLPRQRLRAAGQGGHGAAGDSATCPPSTAGDAARCSRKSP